MHADVKQPANVSQGMLNLLRVYNQANADELDAGLRWYATARDQIGAEFPELDITDACGIVAALSPQMPWARNIQAARESVDSGGTKGGTGDRLKVVKAILAGAKPFDVVTGPKTGNFLENLRCPEVSQCVTIDGHAFAAWLGQRIMTSGCKMTRRQRTACEADYLAVAAILGIKPHQFQAIVWITWRRLHGSKGRVQEIRSANPSAN